MSDSLANVKCPDCDEITYPDANGTEDQDPFHRICLACNKDFNVRVDLIASGYEWTCPNCETFNREIEINDLVRCRKCDIEFETKEARHAYG